MITLNCERSCVYCISDGDCNAQRPASTDPPTAAADLQKTTDADCNESMRGSIAVIENKVCYHFTSFASLGCLLICLRLLCMEIKDRCENLLARWQHHISPTSADQPRQSAADRDSNPPLEATSWSAPPPCTSAPMHSLWRAQRHGTSCRGIYGH